MRDGLIPRGEIDTRSIRDVQPGDLTGFVQCHFFAGIAGWAYALELAGWPTDRPVWTGSCPCQPFSAAGKRKGVEDERHLWPEFRRLIAECNPPKVFGEQVASKDGRVWLAGVRADLEALGYAVGAADLCAAGIGAPHIRQRLFWMADADGGFAGDGDIQPSGQHGQQSKDGRAGERLADTERNPGDARRPANQPAEGAGAPAAGSRTESGRRSVLGGLGDDDDEGLEGRRLPERERLGQFAPWSSSVLVPCADGKARRVEPRIQPLAHGVPNRVGTLRGAGNAIVPQIAAEFIKAFL